MRYSLMLLPILLLTVYTSPLQAVIIHVPGDSTTIQGGINGCSDGDTVMVAPGTYYEHDIDFLGKAITVMGTDPGDSAVVAATVVDADSLGRIFYFHFLEDSSSVLAGLTITGGYAEYGGGIYCSPASPIIANCIITENGADWGSGIYCNYSSPTIENCTIYSNKADINGGGIFCNYSSPMIANCTISMNTTNFNGGGIRIWNYSSPTITDCIIGWNTANWSGGGIYVSWFSTSLITNCTIVENYADDNGGGIYGGGTVTNCILWGDIPDEISGGASIVTYSDVQGGYPGEGNINADPLFIDPGTGDYQLQKGSPCIDAGDPSSANIPWGGWKRDMGAFEYDQGFYFNGVVLIRKPKQLQPHVYP